MATMTATSRLLALGALALLAGCGGGKSKVPQGADEAQKAWQKAGLTASDFAKIDGAPYANGKCSAGTVDGLRTIVCEYGDEAALSRGEQAAYQTLDDAPNTGAVVKIGKSLLVVTDTAKIDPNGKKMNKLANVFRGKSSQ